MENDMEHCPNSGAAWFECAGICANQNFSIDKSDAKRYYILNTQKYAMIRRVIPLRKPREKAAGVSLRERDG